MSVKNFVQCGLVTPVASNTTELVLVAPTASYQYPDLAGGTLVIADSVARPTFYEIISYTHRIDNVLYGVVRAKEGTTARAWTGSVWIYQALTAKDYLDALALKANAANAALTGIPTAPTAAPGTNTNQIATMAAIQAAIAALIQSSPAALDTLNELAAALGDDPNFAATMNAALAGKEPTIVAGTAAQMWLGNKTWATVLSQVQGVLLTGMGAGANSPILATDTLIAALAKIQNQLNNKAASSDSRLTDAREWTAAEVTQAEAEAGTLTTVRKWSPLRVWQAVLASSLTGINLTLGTAVTAADTVLIAIGKLQKQITDAATNLAGNVRATVLTGYVSGSNVTVLATDSVLAAFGKVQAQISARAPLASPALTGEPTGPTAVDGTNTTQLATTAFVQGAVGGYLSRAVTGGTVVLTSTEASNPVIGLSGTLTSNLILEIPVASKRIYSISNGTTGAFTVSIKVTGLTPTVLVAQGKRNLIYTDGVGAFDAINDFDAIALTGVTTAVTAAVGTNTTQVATTAFVNAEIAADAPTKTGGGASGTWPVAITGNAATATALQTARTINGVSFNGTANVIIPAGLPGSVVEGGRYYDFHYDTDLTQDYDVRFEVGDAPAGVSGSGILTIHSGGVTFAGGALTGNGSGLTSLNAANLASGIVPDARLSGTYTGVNITGNASSASAVAWSGVSGKPTTLAGYGITNGYAMDGVNSGWFRSSGVQGWFNETYGGGIYMTDATYVRTYNGKQFACTDAIQIDGATPQIRLNDTSWGVRHLYHDAGLIGFLSSAGGWTFQNDNSGNTTAMGNVTAYSDIRLKKDIELIPDALDKVCALRGVTYERIDSGERQTGVIAQEVQAVLPEAVMTMTDEQQTLSVAYGNLVGLLIEAIKELKAEVDVLKQGAK